MKIDYKSNKLKKQLTEAREVQKAFGVNAKRVAQRIFEMENSPNLEVLKQIPAANCHLLKGDRKGQWAVDISANHRIVFELLHDPIPLKDDGSLDATKVDMIRILDTGDYH